MYHWTPSLTTVKRKALERNISTRNPTAALHAYDPCSSCNSDMVCLQRSDFRRSLRNIKVQRSVRFILTTSAASPSFCRSIHGRKGARTMAFALLQFWFSRYLSGNQNRLEVMLRRTVHFWESLSDHCAEKEMLPRQRQTNQVRCKWRGWMIAELPVLPG